MYIYVYTYAYIYIYIYLQPDEEQRVPRIPHVFKDVETTRELQPVPVQETETAPDKELPRVPGAGCRVPGSSDCSIHTYTQTFISCMFVYICIYTHYEHVYNSIMYTICIHNTHAYMCICVYVCVHIYIYIYTHTFGLYVYGLYA